MNAKERHEFKKQLSPNLYAVTDEQAVQNCVNLLIEALYIPIPEGTKVDRWRLTAFNINDEPINWGDLKCNEVKKFEDGSFLVTIDEASPDGCDTFKEYIETYMNHYGWIVNVETEW